jgi:RecA-family ATPase
MSIAGAELVTPFDEGERALALLARDVRLAAPEEQLDTLRDAAIGLRPFVTEGFLSPATVTEKIFEVADLHNLVGEPGSEDEATIGAIARLATSPPDEDEPPQWFVDSVMPDEDEIERENRLAVADMVRRWEAADPRDNPALTAGDEPPPPADISDYGPGPNAEPEPEAIAEHQRAAKSVPPTSPPLVTVTPSAWRGTPIPPMQWLATSRIPARDVTILSGDGGGGKTTVALQLAVSVAEGLGDWLGTTCEAGPVLFFSAEEPEDEIRRRLDRIARKRGIEPDDIKNLHLHFAKPNQCILGTGIPNHPIAPTSIFASLEATAKEILPALVIVDSNAATLGGNYIDRVHARTFVNLFRDMAQEVGCAVLLLDHPSASGLNNGTGRAGNMDWQNAVRAFLYLRLIENEQGKKGRELEIMKSNYGPIGEKTGLQWEGGHYVLEGSASAPQQAAVDATADQIYLDCLDTATRQGRHVCPMRGRGYAPKVFASMPEAKGLTWRAFDAAQERLFSASQIENVAYGPPSKGTKRIARVTP